MSEWPRLLLGLAAGYFVLQGTAQALDSTRGEWGVLVGALVVLVLLCIERFLYHKPARSALRELGIRSAELRGFAVATGICVVLVCVLPAYAAVTGGRVELYPGWIVLLPGLFAQAGIAEETLFRGFLFRHLRSSRPFWRAAVVSMVPFVAIHLLLFLTMPWEIALASVLLAVIVSFPLAHLFEVGGNSMWAPALVHFTIQGAIKIILVTGSAGISLPIIWMAASAIVPYAAFFVSRQRAP